MPAWRRRASSAAPSSSPLRFEGTPIRFDQAPAAIGPNEGAGLTFTAGLVVYHVKGGRIDDGQLVEL